MDEPLESTAGEAPAPAHAGLTYAALRLLLLVVVGAVLYLLGMRGVLWLLVTVLVSGGLSFFVLLRQREAAARALEASVSARAARHKGGEVGSSEAESHEAQHNVEGPINGS